MIDFEKALHEAFNEKGITLPDWRIKITNREIIGHSDWAKVTVEVYKPRKRKPEIIWELAVNIVRDQIHWDKSNFYRM